MILVDASACHGFDVDNVRDLSLPIPIDDVAISSASRFAGSAYILQMGEHFNRYARTGFLPHLHSLPTFAIPQEVKQLPNKERAKGVSGNIGEGVAAIGLQKLLGLSPDQIVHIKDNTRGTARKTPDFLMDVGQALTSARSGPWPTLPRTIPDVWPVEAKAGHDRSAARSAVDGAFRQLACYWYTIRSIPASVGFGLVSSFAYYTNREFLVRVFVPKSKASHQQLVKYLNSFGDYEAFRKSISRDESKVKECLRGCDT